MPRHSDAQIETSDRDAETLFAGPGEMRALARALDWSATPLGPVEQWSPALRAVAPLVLAHLFPTIVLWGAELVQIYNDAYRELMGVKHPAGLGQPTRECWPEVWHINAPIYERVLCGESVALENALFPITRSGVLEDAWFTLSYSPVYDESGAVEGVFLTIGETTEQVAATRALRESEARSRTLFTAMDQGFCVIERVDTAPGEPSDYRYLTANPAFERHTGMHAVVGRTIRELVPGAELAIMDIYDDAVRTGQHRRFEAHVAALDLWMEAEVFPTEAPDRLAVLFSDVSERKHAEEALRESEEKYRTLFETMGQGYCDLVLVRDADGRAIDQRYLELNPAYERLIGIPVAAARGRMASEVMPELEPEWTATFDRIATRGEPERIEYEVASLGRWFEVFVYPRGGDRLTVLYEDVTNRNRAEEALRASEARLAAVFDALPVGVGVTNATGTLVLSNPAMRRYLPTQSIPSREPGRQGRWIAYEPDGRRVAPIDYPGARALRGELVHPGLEMRYTGDDGREIWTRVAAVPIRDSEEQVTETAVVVTDIDALKRAEERQAFLLALSDAMRPLADTVDIQAVVTERLRDRLAAGWCYYVEWDTEKMTGAVTSDAVRDGLPSLAGVHDVSDVPEFLELLAAGEMLNVADFAGYELLSPRIRDRYTGLGFRSMVVVPLVKHGRLAASLLVGDTEPREWSTDAVTLIAEVADRTWAALERARAEAALRESETRYRTLVENVHDYAIFLLDVDGIIVEWTPGAELVTGYTSSEALGQHCRIFYPERDRDGGEPEHDLRAAAETGRLENEGWRVRKSGERFWADEIVTAVRDVAGRVIGFTKIARDLTHRMLVEAAAERERAGRERDDFRRQLAAAEENERRRIALELHDQLGQHLAALSLGLDEARRMVSGEGSRAGERGALRTALRLQALQELATAMTVDARNLALELRPPELDDVGLASALETYVTRWSERTRIAADVELSAIDDARIPSDVGTAIYRIVQEALTNIVKHAHAQHVSVIVEKPDPHVRLIIEDDGLGFDIDATTQRARAQSRLGLAGMQERATLVGGTFAVESEPGKGATLYVTIPTGHATDIEPRSGA